MRRLSLLVGVLLGLGFGGSAVQAAATGVVEVAAFGARTDGSDTTPAVRAALAEVRRTKATKLVFSPGRYDFWPDRAQEQYLFVSNNDEGLKRIAFPLLGIENLQIDGQGAQLVFHGYVCPFVLEKAKNITIANLSIDWARTFHSEAKVLALHDDGVDVEISPAFPFVIRNGVLVFTDLPEVREPITAVRGVEVLYPYSAILEFDVNKRETASMARDYSAKGGVAVKDLGKRCVRLLMPKLTATPGNILVFGASQRSVPAVIVSDSSGVKLSHVTLYHCGGMGVIAQRSADIELDHVQVTPAPGRIVSLTADATHFVNCTGQIVMSHCLFENQKDDATNIHGIYARVIRKLAPDQVEVKLMHPQQHGFDFMAPGDKIELLHGPSMVTYGEAIVKSVDRFNAEFSRVVFQQPLPDEMIVGDAVASLDGYPEVHIHHCTIRNNRARGILLGSRARTVIEDNVFHTPGSAILFEGDARYWFEQAGVRDCLIRRNRFENCNFGVWGKACIAVGSGIEPDCRPASRYNRNITIEDNLFQVFGSGPLVLAYSVDGLAWRKNRIETTAAYPSRNPDAKRFEITDCDHVVIQED